MKPARTVLQVACAVAAAAWFAAPVAAQDASDTRRVPQGDNRLEVEGGYRHDLIDNGKSQGWYRVTWRGKPVAMRGNALPFTDTVLLDAPTADLGKVEGSDLVLRFEDGTLGVTGGLIDMAGARPIEFAGLEKLRLRGAAFVAADNRFKQVQAGIGIETPPLHLGALGQHEIANWLVLGVNAQRRENADTADDRNFGAVTWRAFIGKGFGWRTPPREALEAFAVKIAAAYVKDVPTMAEARVKQQQFDALAKPTPEQVQFSRAVSAAELDILAARRALPAGQTLSAADEDRLWAQATRSYAIGRREAELLRPTVALYAEASGWNEFRAKGDSGRLKNLFTVSADYWFMPSRDDLLLRLRYENGYERAAPGLRKNQLMASVALRF